MTSLYRQSVPVFIKYLNNLSGLLTKAEAFADKKGMRHDEILNFRLIEDMQGVTYQVQSCSNTAKFIVERLGDQPSIPMEDSETTFAELHSRIRRTLQILQDVRPEWLDGKESEEVVMATKMGDFKFDTKQRYLSEYAIPNFHFHLTSCYCILRHLGVDVGAFDYLKDVFVKA